MSSNRSFYRYICCAVLVLAMTSSAFAGRDATSKPAKGPIDTPTISCAPGSTGASINVTVTAGACLTMSAASEAAVFLKVSLLIVSLIELFVIIIIIGQKPVVMSGS